jgi:hypothetical protein
MVGMGRFTGLGLLVTIAACGTSGVVPKASEVSLPPSAAAMTETSHDPDSEPVVVAPEVIAGWEFLYRFITETEFVLCLEGTQQNGRVIIDGFRLARMETTNVNSVRYQPCGSSRYVGTAHNHPPVGDRASSLCYQSEPDRRSFALDQRAIVDVVLCGADRFYWVTKDGRSAAKRTTLARSP